MWKGQAEPPSLRSSEQENQQLCLTPANALSTQIPSHKRKLFLEYTIVTVQVGVASLNTLRWSLHDDVR